MCFICALPARLHNFEKVTVNLSNNMSEVLTLLINKVKVTFQHNELDFSRHGSGISSRLFISQRKQNNLSNNKQSIAAMPVVSI